MTVTVTLAALPTYVYDIFLPETAISVDRLPSVIVPDGLLEKSMNSIFMPLTAGMMNLVPPLTCAKWSVRLELLNLPASVLTIKGISCVSPSTSDCVTRY